jgi:hypothetical protein
MIHDKVIIACLTAEKYEFDIPPGKCFTNYKIDEELRNEKLLLIKKFESISSIKTFLETLAYKFQIRLNCIVNDEIMITENFGPDIFIKINKFGFIFHTDPGKVILLPPGINCTKNTAFRISDLSDLKLLSNEDQEYLQLNNTLRFENDLKKIEQQLKIGIEVWERTVTSDGLYFIKKRKTETPYPKKRFHHEPSFSILLLVTNRNLYFRGHLNKLKINKN